jgi:hypothetical protein
MGKGTMFLWVNIFSLNEIIWNCSIFIYHWYWLIILPSLFFYIWESLSCWKIIIHFNHSLFFHIYLFSFFLYEIFLIHFDYFICFSINNWPIQIPLVSSTLNGPYYQYFLVNCSIRKLSNTLLQFH